MPQEFSQLEEMIWFLTLNFFKENSDSFLDEGAIVEDGDICNSSCSKLVYDIFKEEKGFFEPRKIRLSTIVGGDFIYFDVDDGRSSIVSPGLFNSSHDIEYGSSKIETYTRGDWEEIILQEYNKRLNEFPKRYLVQLAFSFF